MKTLQIIVLITSLLVASSSEAVKWSKASLRDKIKGGWAGQTIGVTYGGPTEFKFKGTMIPDYVPINWYPELYKDSYVKYPGLYDDIYCDLTFVDVIEKKGLNASIEDYADAFKNSKYQLWHANQQGRYNLLSGIKPREAGHWRNNPCADDIDFQIEADFAGLMSPAMPWRASEICDVVGHIMNSGDGYYGGVFVANMYAWAFITSDVKKIVTNALKAIPQKSRFHQAIADVIKWHKASPKNWKATWYKVQEKYDYDVADPKGIFNPFNIDASLNAAYVVIGLLYGEGDFGKTIEIATRCGQDSDCNPSTAAGVLGVVYGYEKIPRYWMNGLEQVEDLPFSHTTISLKQAYELSYKHALQNLESSGARFSNDSIEVKSVKLFTVPFEQNFDNLVPIFASNYEELNSDNNYTYSFPFEGEGYVVNGDFSPGFSKKLGQAPKAKLLITEDGVTRTVDVDLSLIGRPFVPFYNYQMKPGKHQVTLSFSSDDKDVVYRLQNYFVLVRKKSHRG